MASRWPALLDELEASIASLRVSIDLTTDEAPKAAERRAIERSLDRYQAAAAAVTGYVDAYLAATAPRPRT
jgi:hypothetical protein